MSEMKMTFKNALCLASLPEMSNPFAAGLARCFRVRYKYCQRRADHGGPHRSWSREWTEGEKNSRLRLSRQLDK